MKRHCLVLPAGVPRGRLFPSELCLSAISRVVWTWPDPLPTGLNGDGKNVQTLWWAELDRLHSKTRAHPPLSFTSLFGKDPLPSSSAGKLSFSTSLLQHFTAESSRETSRGKC